MISSLKYYEDYVLRSDVKFSVHSWTFSSLKMFSFSTSLSWSHEPELPREEERAGWVDWTFYSSLHQASGLCKRECKQTENRAKRVIERRKKIYVLAEWKCFSSRIMRDASPVLFSHQYTEAESTFRMKKSYKIYYSRNEILIYNVQSNAGSLLTWK